MRSLFQDFRLAWRGLRHRPWLGLAAVLTFGAGIGLNVAVFSVVDRVLVRGLPYHEPDRLVTIRQGDGLMMPAAVGEAARQTGAFESFGHAGVSFPLGMTTDRESPRLLFFQASASLLRVLGVRVSLGRDFVDDDVVQKRRLVLLSHEAWQTKFGGTPDVLARTISGNIEIAGVLPEGFIPPGWAARPPRWDGLLLEVSSGPTGVEIPTRQGLIGGSIARLAPGVTVEAARAQLLGMLSGLAPRGAKLVRVDPLRSAMFEHERPASLLVLAASGLLLLLACANLSTLLLAHARARERRAAISAAIGATRWRLVRQALAEAVIVCVCGTIAAFAVLAPAATALASALPPLVARHATGVMDLRVLAAAAAAAAICAAAAGLGPALRATRVDLLALLQRMPTSARRQRTSLKASLLAVESALAVLLAVSAMLLLRTFANLERDDIGFEPRGLHTVMVAGPRASRGEDLTAFYEQAAETIGSIPGIAAVAVGDSVAVAGAAPWSGSQTSDGTRFARYEVSASYFDTLQSAPVAGRPFTTAEARARARVALLNLSGARQLWPDALPANVVGRVVTFKDGSSLTVVGVLPDFKPGYGALSRAVPLALFVPFGLDPAPIGDIVVRTVTGGPPDVSMLRQRIRDRLAGVTSVETFPVEERYLSSLRDPRFRATLLATLALTGLLVAASGLLAVALFDARQREYEIGVRLSYGATGGDIQRLIVAHASRPVAAGLAIGIVAAYWATTFLQQFLYQIEPRDPGTYAVVAGIVALTALAATWLPAWRAGRLDPSIVLRAQ